MADNVIRVNVTTVAPKSVTIQGSKEQNYINATGDTSGYNAQLAKNWAIGEGKIQGIDYSSKHYAGVAKEQAELAGENLNTVQNIVAEFSETASNAGNQLAEAKDNAISEINNLNTSVIEGIETASNEAIAGIEGARSSAVADVATNKNTAINEIKTKGDTAISSIEAKGQEQIKNIEKTGFFMENDKLFFINSEGEVEEFSSGGGLEICDIGTALYIDETKGKRRWLNGQIVAINGNTQAFLKRLKEIQLLHPSLFTTEENWQAVKTLSAFGQVGLFVIDEEAGTIRIPAVVNIQGLFDLQNLGLTVQAGLPNITGTTSSFDWVDNNALKGAFKASSTYSQKYAGGSNSASVNNIFDASLSNPIYGNSDTVQEEAIQYPYFIQIATGSETKAEIINEIELNNPFSLLDYKYSEYELNNISWLRSQGQFNSKAIYPAVYDLLLKIYNGTEIKAGVSVKLSTETFTDYDFVINVEDETFRLPLKVKLAGGKAVVGNGNGLGLTDGTNIASLAGYSSQVTARQTTLPVAVGTTLGSTYLADGKAIGVVTDPTKSGIETSDSDLYLYFYVGETVQNAHLINAGRIQEHYTTKSMVDGQWVYPPKTASYLTWTTSGTKTIDLSSVLPNDGYNYECLFGISFFATNQLNVYIGTDLVPVTTDDPAWVYNNGAGKGASGTIILAVGIGRKVQVNASAAPTSGTYHFALCGYRRLGTNV